MPTVVENVRLRAITAADVAAVAALERQLFSHPHSEQQFGQMLGPRHLGCVVESSSRTPACVAAVGGAGDAKAADAVLGYGIVSFGGGQADLLVIAVDAAWQGRGLAARVLRWLWHELAQRQVADVFLEVRQSNLAAIRCYQRQGFEPLGRRRNYYPGAAGQREDALLFGLSLRPDACSDC